MNIEDKVAKLGKAKIIGRWESSTPEWHEARSKGVGGSQVGTILGLNPWESAYTAWAKATGLIEDVIEPSVAMKLGNLFEKPLIELASEQNKIDFWQTGTWQSQEYDFAHANPDALFEWPDGEPGVLEIKYSKSAWWDGVPKHYEAQVKWYLWVLGLKRGIIFALAGGEVQQHEIELHDFEAGATLEQVKTWWSHVIEQTPPIWDGSRSTYETARSLAPKGKDEVVELGDLGVALMNAQTAYDAAESHLFEMKARTLEALDGAKFGSVYDRNLVQLQYRNGKPFITYKKGY
jgi:putative phage-type endonuclease